MIYGVEIQAHNGNSEMGNQLCYVFGRRSKTLNDRKADLVNMAENLEKNHQENILNESLDQAWSKRKEVFTSGNLSAKPGVCLAVKVVGLRPQGTEFKPLSTI